MNSDIKNIAIIGLGLIGSSILHALKVKHNNQYKTYAYDINEKYRSIIKKMDISYKVCNKISEAVKNADLIILAIPVGSMGKVAKDINPHVKKGTIIIDTGSTKISVIKDVTPFIPDHSFYIPSHPLAGTEHSGPESGFSSLFENRYWIIISAKKNSNTKLIEKFFIKLGAVVDYMNAEYHDKIMAMTSHLPHLIAFTIVGTANQLEKDLKNDVVRYSATGFRDFTRLASSDPTMWRDVFTNNSDSVLEMLQRFNEDLTYLQKLIRQKNGTKLYNFFKNTKIIRSRIIDAGQHELEDVKK
tara:strand:- start:409 stop:1308 length:900 start_codon:yes stop_codon:yes gene_type:complete